jgi:hypothetical protein
VIGVGIEQAGTDERCSWVDASSERTCGIPAVACWVIALPSGVVKRWASCKWHKTAVLSWVVQAIEEQG